MLAIAAVRSELAGEDGRPVRGPRRCRRRCGDERRPRCERGRGHRRARRKPAISIAARSLTSSPMKQIFAELKPMPLGERAQRGRLVLAALVDVGDDSSWRRSDPPAGCPRRRSARRSSPPCGASETPMMSAKEKRFHSSPSGPHQNAAVGEHAVDVQRDRLDRRVSMPRAHAAELLDDRLSRVRTTRLTPSPIDCLDEADVAHQRVMPFGSSEAAWSEPHMARSSVMCRSMQQAPSATAATVDGNAGLVAGVAHRHAVALAQRRDRPQVQLLVVRGVGAAGVQQDQVFRAQHFHGVVDLLDGAHAGGEDDRLALGARVAQQGVVGQRGRGDLVAGRRRTDR